MKQQTFEHLNGTGNFFVFTIPVQTNGSSVHLTEEPLIYPLVQEDTVVESVYFKFFLV